MNIIQTSARQYGQIYIPAINWVLLALVLAAVFGFGSSSALASAYGVAVTGTMTVTTILTFFVTARLGLSAVAVHLRHGFFFLIDATFFSAALLKIFEGGWFPPRARHLDVHHHDHLAPRAR